MINRPPPLLSIIVPVLNEAETLPGLLSTLAQQHGVAFEVILCDGGSTDVSLQSVAALAKEVAFEVRVVNSLRGRGAQLNAGARVARGGWLLFLHADSQFDDPMALVRSLDALKEAMQPSAKAVAGHFALRFKDRCAQSSAAYAYYEFKASLDRAECTHGDQGFLLSRSLFQALGPFDEALPLLEDTRFAEKLRASGRWLLLPADILTSARRFETEGLLQRQVLNAFIMNFSAIGWNEFFKAIPGVYRSQDCASKLRLRPFFEMIHKLLLRRPLRERARLWYLTGGYVRGHAWQLVLAWKVCRNLRTGVSPGQGSEALLKRFDRGFGGLTDNRLGRMVATALVWSWFYLAWGWLRLRDGGLRKHQP